VDSGLQGLNATATDGAGLKSATFLQLVVLEPSQFVRRYLPTSYNAGVAFTVRLTAKPGTNIHAWAVEEHPPKGWVFQPLTWDGVLDAPNDVIKWGPFTDLQVRDLMYTIIPPTNATGFQEFSGIVSANGNSAAIVGDLRINNVLPHHPADIEPEDYRITVDELTAYAAAWKTHTPWNRGPADIPIDYVTRAGLIWKNREVYRFNPALPAPTCWLPTPQAQLAAALAVPSRATRLLAPSFTPGATMTVTIHVQPAADVQAYAIEERPPAGWTIVDADGASISAGNLRYGPFFDPQERTFVYYIVPAQSTSEGDFEGVASFDGASQSIAGNAISHPGIATVESRDGHVYLHFNASPGAQFILESADALDSVNWHFETTINGNGSAIDLPPIEPSEDQKFYRLRPVTP
jgi:hypothetical protein